MSDTDRLELMTLRRACAEQDQILRQQDERLRLVEASLAGLLFERALNIQQIIALEAGHYH